MTWLVNNPPANAAGIDLIPDPRGSHVPQSNKAPQLLSLCSRAWESKLLNPRAPEPVLHNKRSHCDERPAHRNQRVGLAHGNYRKSSCSEDPAPRPTPQNKQASIDENYVPQRNNSPWVFHIFSEFTLTTFVDREAWRAAIHEVAKSQTRLSD